MAEHKNVITRLQTRIADWQNIRRIRRVASQVAANARPATGQQPVIFFNASARLEGLSQNAAFSLLSSWSLRLAGVRVIHFVSRAGMSRCVLGTNRSDFSKEPPCERCYAQSDLIYSGAERREFTFQRDLHLEAALQGLSLDELSRFEYPLPSLPEGSPGIPLGELIIPSMRWVLRRHHLPDDEPTRFLFREYILSAYHVAREFLALVQEVNPAAAVVFNGIMYPESTVKWVARQSGVRVITHEIGFQRFSAFFTEGEATAYPLHIPDEFELSDVQNQRLNDYLENRFQGKFTMAGIRFWPEMRGLDDDFLKRAAQFKQIVPVFTNVVFDTSQVHANTVFPDMFAWLDLVLEVIRSHPETLFVIRAHPDEMRPGTRKKSNESVQEWVERNGVSELPNVVFIPPTEYISSYELISKARFVMVYNSSIGLEASLLGVAVVCGGKARYTQYPTVYFPSTADEYRRTVETFLNTTAGVEQGQPIPAPEEFQRNARRFLYYQFFRASLPFSDYLESHNVPGFVRLRSFSWQCLLPENSPALQVITAGILGKDPDQNATFLLGDEDGPLHPTQARDH